jgi:hypothetical protein
LCFLDAIEFDESKPFRRNSIKPSYVSGTDDIVTACGFSLFGKGFVSLGIGYFLNGNDNVKRRLGEARPMTSQKWLNSSLSSVEPRQGDVDYGLPKPAPDQSSNYNS